MLGLFSFVFAPQKASAGEDPQDLLIIASKKVKADYLSLDEVKAIFLKKKPKWSDGMNAVPILASRGTKIHNEFRETVFGKS